MKEKYLRIETDRAIYKLPLSVVAENRAKYYEGKEAGSYDEEYKLTMDDDYEGIDWLQNNMDYDDFCHELEKVEDTIRLEEDWSNAEIEIYRNI